MLAAVWGSSFVFIKLGVEEMPPLAFTALRLLVAGGGFTVAYALLGKSLRPPEIMPFVWIALGGNVLPFSLISWGESVAPSTEAAIVIGAMPCFALLLGGWFGDESINGRRLLGIGIGFLGVLLLFEGRGHFLSTSAFLVAAFSYAAAAVYGRRLTSRYRVWDIVAFSTIFAALIMAVPLPFIMPATFGSQAVTMAVILGLVHTALAGMLFFYLLKTCGITFTAFCNYAIPLFGAFWGWLFLGERLGITHLLALLMVLLGLAAIHRQSPGRRNPIEAGERRLDMERME